MLKNHTLFPMFVMICATQPTFAQDWHGMIEGGLFASNRDSTQEDILVRPLYGYFLDGAVSRDFGALKFSLDGRVEFGDGRGEDDIDFTGPLHAGVLGLHLGTDLGNTYVGGFVATGIFDGYDSEDPMSGEMAGLEIVHPISPNVSLTAQLGWAELIGDPGDNEYIGYIAHIGVDAKINERMSASLGLDNGRSENCFVDCGDVPGQYFGVSLGLDYQMSEALTLVGELNQLRVLDYDDADSGSDLSLYLGARMTFGAKGGGSGQPRTPIQVYRAAGYMDSLD